MTKDYIIHKGIVDRIEKHRVLVKITQKTACSDCHAKSACLSSDSKEKIIEVSDNSGQFALNEEVVVSAQSSMGLFAVALAFVVPLILVAVTIFTATKISINEATSGVIGLLILIPYYLTLYFFRNKLKDCFVFTISKVNTEITEPLNTVTY